MKEKCRYAQINNSLATSQKRVNLDPEPIAYKDGRVPKKKVPTVSQQT